MKYLCFLFFSITVMLLGCGSPGKQTVVSLPGLLDSFEIKKNTIDTLMAKDRRMITTYSLLENHENVLKNANILGPDKPVMTFHVLRDSIGRVLAIFQVPAQKNMKWSIGFTHYFDEDGNTFAFERHGNFTNLDCVTKDRYICDERIEYFDSNFKSIAKAHILKDDLGRTLTNANCSFTHDSPYDILPNVKKYFNTYAIPN